MAAKSKQQIQKSGSKEELIKKAERAANDAGFSIKSVDEDLGTIEAKTGFSLWSWSEKINIYVSDGQIDIVSECAMPTQLIDWGKNKRNVQKFTHHLNQNS